MFVFHFRVLYYSAWIQEEHLYLYNDHKDKFKMTKKIPRGYKEALEAIDAELKAKPCVVRFIHMNDFTDNSNPGKHGSRRRIREKSILTTFKWKVCVLNDIQLKRYLHHCVGLKLNFQVIYLF